MREIRFRGKRIDNGRWVEGSYLKMFHGLHMDGNHHIHFIIDRNNVRYEVDPHTVGQYAGLKDKNGKEIYEGDFFKDIADGYLWQVFYDEGCYYASSGPDTLMLQEFLMKSGKCDVEVIGNIYEHPHLLKGDGNDA